MDELTKADGGPGAIATYSQAARDYERASLADNTLTAYRRAFAAFQSWAAGQGQEALPADPETVRAYLAALADAPGRPALASIKLQAAGIGYAHRAANLADPTKAESVRRTMRGIGRKLAAAGRAAPDKAAALQVDDLRAAVAALPAGTLAGVRDRAILLVGFWGAFRRSELTGLDLSDLDLSRLRSRGEILIRLRQSKTDQTGEEARPKCLPTLEDADVCPVRALRAWIDAADIKAGAVFRRIDRGGIMRGRLTPQSVALIVKAAGRRAGLEAGRLSGHSLRSGFVTLAKDQGAADTDVMAQTGHKSADMVARYNQGEAARRAVLQAAGALKTERE